MKEIFKIHPNQFTSYDFETLESLGKYKVKFGFLSQKQEKLRYVLASKFERLDRHQKQEYYDRIDYRYSYMLNNDDE